MLAKQRHSYQVGHDLVHKSIKQHVLLTLINAGLALRSTGQDGGVLSLPAEEQVVLARQLADSHSDSAITRHLRSNHDCLMAVCSHVFDLFSVLARTRNRFHLDVLEAVYIKHHSPALCQQKEYVKALYLM